MEHVATPTLAPDFGGEPSFIVASNAQTALPSLTAGLTGSERTAAEAAALADLIIEAERLGAIHNAHERANDVDHITDAAEVVWMAKHEEALAACAAMLATAPAGADDRVARATVALRGAAYLHTHRKHWRPLTMAAAVQAVIAVEADLIAQAAVYLAGSALAGPTQPDDCPVAALGPDLERLLQAESLDNPGAYDERTALTLRIADLQAKSVSGAVLQLLLACEQAELIRGCYREEDRDHHHDTHTKLITSAIQALGLPASAELQSAYLGFELNKPAPATSDAPTVADLLSAGDDAFTHDRDDEHAALSAAFVAAPIRSNADAIAKLRWMKRAFTAGETGSEIQVLRQLVEFLGADADTCLVDPVHDEPTLLAAE